LIVWQRHVTLEPWPRGRRDNERSKYQMIKNRLEMFACALPVGEVRTVAAHRVPVDRDDVRLGAATDAIAAVAQNLDRQRR